MQETTTKKKKAEGWRKCLVVEHLKNSICSAYKKDLDVT